MAYSSETNTAILNLFSRAQTRIAANATENALYIYEGDDDEQKFLDNLTESEDLSDLILAVDNQYNNWTEAEVVKVLQFYDIKHKLQNIPYVQRDEYNLNITVTEESNSSGTVADGDKGDITVSTTGTVWTIDNSAVTLAKIQDISQDVIIGRVSTGAGVAEELTTTQVRTLLTVETTAELDTRDTANRARANHTGTQLAATISDFNSSVTSLLEWDSIFAAAEANEIQNTVTSDLSAHLAGTSTFDGVNWNITSGTSGEVNFFNLRKNASSVFKVDIDGNVSVVDGHSYKVNGIDSLNFDGSNNVNMENGVLTVRNGDASVTPNSSSVIVAETTSALTAISIVGTSTHRGILMFGDNADSFIGGIEYSHSTDEMKFYANNLKFYNVNSDREHVFIADFDQSIFFQFGEGDTAFTFNENAFRITPEQEPNVSGDVAKTIEILPDISTQLTGHATDPIYDFLYGDVTSSGRTSTGAANYINLKKDSTEVFRMDIDGKMFAGNIFYMKSYTVATLPSASIAAGLIYVIDETGGAVPAFSDGSSWRRVQDRAIVS